MFFWGRGGSREEGTERERQRNIMDDGKRGKIGRGRRGNKEKKDDYDMLTLGEICKVV